VIQHHYPKPKRRVPPWLFAVAALIATWLFIRPIHNRKVQSVNFVGPVLRPIGKPCVLFAVVNTENRDYACFVSMPEPEAWPVTVTLDTAPGYTRKRENVAAYLRSADVRRKK
jgi:hypothetical protein